MVGLWLYRKFVQPASTLVDGERTRTQDTSFGTRINVGRSERKRAYPKYIGNDGTTELAQKSVSNAKLAKAFLQGPTHNRSDIYLVLTNKMAQWTPSISAGTMGQRSRHALPIHRGTNQLEYREIACTGNGS